MDFVKLTEQQLSRSARWHRGGLHGWSVSDWAVAMAGEAGEVCNAVKKLNRIRDEIPNISERAGGADANVVIDAIGEEIADTFLYLHLLALRLGIDFEKEVVKKFNSVSEKYGFPERL